MTESSQTVVIDKQLTYSLQLYLLKGQAPGDSVVSIQVVPLAVGFITGQSRKWLTGNYSLANHQLRYQVDALVTWKLLGSTIYTQTQQYKGVAALK